MVRNYGGHDASSEVVDL